MDFVIVSHVITPESPAAWQVNIVPKLAAPLLAFRTCYAEP